MASFSATVDKWVLESKERMVAVRNLALEYTVEGFLLPWPVDTGFSRASFTASTTGFVPLQENKGSMPNVADYVATIAATTLADTIYASFAANYAVFIEYGSHGREGRGLVRMALQNWQSNVNRAVSVLRAQ